MKRSVILSLLFLIAFLTVLTVVLKTDALSQDQAADELVRVRLVVHIFDIDQAQKTAQLQTFVFLDDFPYNVSSVSVLITGAGGVWITCNQTGQSIGGWYYQGESGQETWLLSGIGETFPFDSYILRFDVQNMDYVGTNYTLASSGHQAFFDGEKAYSLNDLWITEGNLIPVGSISSRELNFSIIRSGGALDIYFLEFLVPIIACYYLLGSTLILDPKKYLSERLGVYVSLFVFVPIFLVAIRDFLPYRSTLSLPELLLVNLVLSTAIFAMFSIVGKMKASRPGRRATKSHHLTFPLPEWDIVGVVLSLLLLMVTYVVTLIWKVNLQTSMLLTYLVIPGYVCSIPFFITRRQFMEKWRRYLLIVLIFLLPAVLLAILPVIIRLLTK